MGPKGCRHRWRYPTGSWPLLSTPCRSKSSLVTTARGRGPGEVLHVCLPGGGLGEVLRVCLPGDLSQHVTKRAENPGMCATRAQILPVPVLCSRYPFTRGLRSLAHWPLSQEGSALTRLPPLLKPLLSMLVDLWSFPLGHLLGMWSCACWYDSLVNVCWPR